MPARKMRIELFDGEGNRYTVSFQGQLSREKALRVLDLVELLGGVPNSAASLGGNRTNSNYSKYDKVQAVILRHFPVGWFSSTEIQSVYELETKEPISLSTVATYLSRMTDRGILVKTRVSRGLKYKMAPSYPAAVIQPKIPLKITGKERVE